MLKLFKSPLGPCCSLATASHLQTSELVCGQVLFNSLPTYLTYISVRLPVHYVCQRLALAAMLHI